MGQSVVVLGAQWGDEGKGKIVDIYTQYADMVVRTVSRIPELQDGDNPIFTLNAYAYTGEGETDPLFASIPDKIVFGDGIQLWTVAYRNGAGQKDFYEAVRKLPIEAGRL